MIYYKVVDELAYSYLSFSHSLLPSRYIIGYKIGEWVKGPYGTKLFVFDNLIGARKFSRLECSVIFACEVTNPLVVGFGIVPFPLNKSQPNIDKYWEKFHNIEEYNLKLIAPPQGTVLVDSVKLLKKVT